MAFVGESWVQYGGRYWLDALHLDVEGVQDDIGHDNGSTRYTVRREHGGARVMLPHDAVDWNGTYTPRPQPDLPDPGRGIES
jgi:hypothetical protein